MSVIEQPETYLHVHATYRRVKEEFAAHFPRWLKCASTKDLEADADYAALAQEISQVLGHCDTGDFARDGAPAKSCYRVIAWNLERGIQYEAQLEAFRSHPYLKSGDVFLLTEADLGMARSRNRAVAQELARELGMYYAFIPCYLNLAKGSGVEYHVEGENELGLHGNAILSRYPIRRVQPIPLRNGIDKMSGRAKRLGHQHALAAEAGRAEVERARRAVLEERSRIARELHDVVAHHMSLIAVRAETAPYRLAGLTEPARAEFGSLSEALTPDTAVVSVMCANNETGARQPLVDAGAVEIGRAIAVDRRRDGGDNAGKGLGQGGPPQISVARWAL